ncbi:hypothetical protein BGY98DRAFT_941004, partial [Russula aff. rugulosa BPL654]
SLPEKKPAVSSLYSSYYPPSSYAPEPRQRTREPGLLSREFTARPRPRPRAHPSPSASSYRALWDRRYTLRRSTRSSNDNTNTNSGGGGGSLWRSLSFAARHKKVLPPAPTATSPSALNSPTMTVVTTSVTSEVLPSYLPSPQFDGPTAAPMLAWSTASLPPPPLHTRGEASDPDDSRMKELRGVYEAVARALGSTHGV